MGAGRRGGRRRPCSGAGRLACVEPSRSCRADGGTPRGAAQPSADRRRPLRGAAGRALGGLYGGRDRPAVAGAVAAMAVGAPRPRGGRARDPGRPERPRRRRARRAVRRPSRRPRGRRVHPRRRRARRRRLGARHRPGDLSARRGRQLLDHHRRGGRRGAPAGADERERPPRGPRPRTPDSPGSTGGASTGSHSCASRVSGERTAWTRSAASSDNEPTTLAPLPARASGCPARTRPTNRVPAARATSASRRVSPTKTTS